MPHLVMVDITANEHVIETGVGQAVISRSVEPETGHRWHYSIEWRRKRMDLEPETFGSAVNMVWKLAAARERDLRKRREDPEGWDKSDLGRYLRMLP